MPNSPEVGTTATTLPYAPRPRSGARVGWVLGAGLMTTGTTLALLAGLSARYDINVLNWFYYSIPFGAVLAGVVAGTGYAIGGKRVGIRPRATLLWVIVAVCVLAYFVADYAMFRSMGPLVYANSNRPLTYVDYFHAKATSWRIRSAAFEGESLGVAGYFFSLAGIAAFAVSAAAVPWWFGSDPYCERCERYLRRRSIGLWPADIPVSAPAGESSGAEGWGNMPQYETAEAMLKRVVELARAGDLDAAQQLLVQIGEWRGYAAGQIRRFQVDLWSCPTCSYGYVQGTWVSGKGARAKRTACGKHALPPEFVGANRTAVATVD